MLDSFPGPLRVAVVGASGGIGSALCDALEESGRLTTLYALCRDPGALNGRTGPRLRLDLINEASIAAAATAIARDGPLDLVIVATGSLQPLEGHPPERSWRQLDPDALAAAFAINATGPALVAKHFLDLLSVGRKSVFAVLSARVGSIEDNRLGGWHAYRASKAAVHQIVRTCSIELARRNPSACCVALHPGTVETKLSRPFLANVAAEKLFAPARAAAQLLAVLDGLTPGSSGQAFAWNGERLPF